MPHNILWVDTGVLCICLWLLCSSKTRNSQNNLQVQGENQNHQNTILLRSELVYMLNRWEKRKKLTTASHSWSALQSLALCIWLLILENSSLLVHIYQFKYYKTNPHAALLKILYRSINDKSKGLHLHESSNEYIRRHPIIHRWPK